MNGVIFSGNCLAQKFAPDAGTYIGLIDTIAQPADSNRTDIEWLPNANGSRNEKSLAVCFEIPSRQIAESATERQNWFAQLEGALHENHSWAWIGLILPECDPEVSLFIVRSFSSLIKGKFGAEVPVLMGGVLPRDDESWFKHAKPYINGVIVDSIAVGMTLRQNYPDLAVLSRFHPENAEESLVLFATSASSGLTGTILYHSASASIIASTMRDLASILPEGAAVDLASDNPIVFRQHEQAGEIQTTVFFDAGSLTATVLYWAPGLTSETACDLIFGSSDFAHPQIHDLLRGKVRQRFEFRCDDVHNQAIVNAIPLCRYPLVFQHERRSADSGLLAAYEAQVGQSALMTVDQIIARSQIVESAQKNVLNTYIGEATVDLHFKIPALNIAFDLSIPSTFYYSVESGLEWEQHALYLNGLRWRGLGDLDLPMIEPEKVKAAPLEISLNENYRYQQSGEERVNEFDCYRINFSPITTETTLFEGTVWIDKRSFRRVQLRTNQRGLSVPVLASTQTEFYSQVGAVDGRDVWLPTRIRGQQIFSTAGRSTIVDREVNLNIVSLNPADFEQRIRQAYSSNNRIMRDTPDGLRVLDRTQDGGRVQRGSSKPAMLFALIGTIADTSQDYPLPLIGLNYYDFNLCQRGGQINVLFGGAFATVNVFHPNFFGTYLEVGSDLVAFAVSLNDEVYQDSIHYPEQSINILPCSINLNVARTFSDHLRLQVTYQLSYQGFMKNEDTAVDFIPPRDGVTHSARLTAQYDVRKTSLVLWHGWDWRQSWREWGADGGGETPKEYQTYGGALSRDFFPFRFAKIHVEGAGIAGQDLDRFSKFQFGFLGNYLHGYGTGILRADRALTLKTSFGIGIAEIVRAELYFDQGWLQNVDAGRDFNYFPGIGVGGGFQGPWEMLVNFDYGYGFKCPREHGNEGNHVVQLRILKIF